MPAVTSNMPAVDRWTTGYCLRQSFSVRDVDRASVRDVTGASAAREGAALTPNSPRQSATDVTPFRRGTFNAGVRASDADSGRQMVRLPGAGSWEPGTGS